MFKFYNDEDFSGDLIFTWKLPSLVKDGDYIGKREFIIDNRRVIRNLFPNYCTNKKYSLNLNRNGNTGDFPHDFFDIYLDHVAQYAYFQRRPKIKEYYPLKRAIQYENNMKFFKQFNSFEDFLQQNFLTEIWEKCQEEPFSEMEFSHFQEVTKKLMDERGKFFLQITSPSCNERTIHSSEPEHRVSALFLLLNRRHIGPSFFCDKRI